MKKITLEDNGQDFLEIITEDSGFITETRPFQTEIWKDGYIPLDSPEFYIGGILPIHKPPHIIYGFLKHKVIKIENI